MSAHPSRGSAVVAFTAVVAILALHVTAAPVPAHAACPPSTSGTLPPASGGFGTFGFCGGTFDDLLTTSGCPHDTALFFYNRPDGTWAVWLPGATVLEINAPIRALFPTGIPANTIFTARCDAGAARTTSSGFSIAFGARRSLDPGLALEQLYIVNSDGSREQRLTGFAKESTGVPANLAWSPDGTAIAFTYEQDLWTIRPDGSDLTNLTHSGGVRSFAWSPHGTTIAFEGVRPTGSPYQPQEGILYLIDRDGSNLRILVTLKTDPRMVFLANPSWSPDGRQIVFAEQAQERDSSGNVSFPEKLYIVTADGTGSRRFLTEGADPTWSPRGDLIAFQGVEGARTAENFFEDIYVIRADGTGRTRLTDDPGFDRRPQWSPDGSLIAWWADRRSAYFESWVMAADGTNPRMLVRGPEADDFAWSPDSLWLIHPVRQGIDRSVAMTSLDAQTVKYVAAPAYDIRSPVASPPG
ncbi:MAG: hypothetical protein U0446_02590 [Dehalococcoidia bacterium]